MEEQKKANMRRLQDAGLLSCCAPVPRAGLYSPRASLPNGLPAHSKAPTARLSSPAMVRHVLRPRSGQILRDRRDTPRQVRIATETLSGILRVWCLDIPHPTGPRCAFSRAPIMSWPACMLSCGCETANARQRCTISLLRLSRSRRFGWAAVPLALMLSCDYGHAPGSIGLKLRD